MTKPIGVVLSGSTTRKVIAQLYEEFEGKVREGELCLIHLSRHGTKLLCRINKLTPFSEFFEEGDAWSEARRKMAQVPSDVARRYYTLDIEVLGEIKGGHLTEATIPPSPGDHVFGISNEKEILEIIRPGGEDKILTEFGRLFGYKGVPFCLDLDALPMHLAILGVTGSGKSYTTGYLIEQLSDIEVKGRRTALTTIVIDANGDYLDYYKAFHVEGRKIGSYADVVRFVFNKSRAKFEMGVKTISIDIDIFSPREVAELIITYYSGGGLPNELQVAGLETALRRLYEDGYSMVSLFIYDQNFKKLKDELVKLKNDGLIHVQTFQAIERALNKFKDDVVDSHKLLALGEKATFNSKFIDSITNGKEPSLVIVDFSADGAPGVSLQIRQLVVAYITKLLLKRFMDYKMEGVGRILLLIIEEAQNYCPNLDVYPIGYSLARDNLAQIATQGRKFGLSLCLVSQRPSFVDQVVLSMVNTFIIHRISVGDVPFVKKVAGGLPEVIEEKLTNLATGRAIITGQMNRLGFPVIVDIPGRKVKQTMGKISVSQILTQ